MKQIAVQDQVRLGWRKILGICLNGIYFRLFRSIITLAIIAMAVAFMCNMLMEGLISTAVYQGVARRSAQEHQFARWVALLSENLPVDKVADELAREGPGSPVFQAIRAWGQLNEQEALLLWRQLEQEQPYRQFFNALSPGKRYVLIGGRDGNEALAWLAESDQARQQFAERLQQQRSLRLPGETGIDGLSQVLDGRRTVQALWQRVDGGRRQAVQQIVQRWPGWTNLRLLAEPPADLQAVLQQQGFRWQGDELIQLSDRSRDELAINALVAALRDMGLRRELADYLGISVTLVDLDEVARMCRSRSGRGFFFQQLDERGLALKLERPELEAALKRYLQRRNILDIESRAGIQGTGLFGFTRRMAWLVLVACVVCVVGITNAMLMSVMERFREIATMKCLGATDGFVLVLFIAESCVQGLAGGVFGAVLALLLSMPVALLKYGGLIWQVLPIQPLLIAGGVGVFLGVLLAAVASVYPAWFASRLAPMEAMRVE